MNLHTNQHLFKDAVIAASQQFNIPEIYVEKDYWVTVALHCIFNASTADQAVFKGGTALSKCHKLVNRFSEDVDIVVLNKEGESGNKLKNKLKGTSKNSERQIYFIKHLIYSGLSAIFLYENV